MASVGYSELLQALYVIGYTRVERDDRLLDVFLTETREKGVELWEHWQKYDVNILRVRLPYSVDELKLYALARAHIERLLFENQTAELANFELVAEGATAADKI